MINLNGIARKRYNTFAPLYDAILGSIEGNRTAGWRKLLWSKTEGNSILEVGVGTGRNFPYYPPNVHITAIDFAENMLKRARNKAVKLGFNVRLQIMDVQNLEFDDNTFDTVLASLVFCSVPDPVRGLKEVKRVCKPGAKVALIEHVLSDNRIAALFMNLFNPLTLRIGGENFNRRTVEHIIDSGLTVESVTDLGWGIFKLIEARKQAQ